MRMSSLRFWPVTTESPGNPLSFFFQLKKIKYTTCMILFSVFFALRVDGLFVFLLRRLK